MAHKYLEDIINIENTPYGWSKNTGRDVMWKKQRETCGFDERETWSLDATFFCWLYERLIMFKEVAGIDLTFHKFNIQGEELTQEQCIDRMIKICKKIITYDGIESLFDEKEEVLNIWKECIHSMWW